MPDDFVDLIITSPPYASAQKYVRASSLSLGWLDLAPSRGLSELEQRTIGREHIRKAGCPTDLLTSVHPSALAFIASINDINPRRAAITATYLREMSDAVTEMARVLKPGAHAIVVIGDNCICGIPFQSTRYLIEMFAQNGCSQELHLVDRIPSRGLMTKRAKTAGVITEETILMFKKSIQG
ncbi:hypothetical protein ACU4GA_12625 [Methylobacterium oryzae CBMB20]